jgi:hypothetical protein
MKMIADQLPPEFASQLHPDRRRNEEEYWSARDNLLKEYFGQWVGFANGKVVASGKSPVAVFHAAEQSGLHPFLICVGKENVPIKIRRASFGYDTAYSGEPLPCIKVEFKMSLGASGIAFDRVIPDTGADASILPWSDCQRLQLTPFMGVQRLMSGVTGHASSTFAFQIVANVDGRDYLCHLQADFLGNERILGRDVMNQFEILFRGPTGEVVVNP